MKKLRLILKCLSSLHLFSLDHSLLETHMYNCLLRSSTCMSKTSSAYHVQNGMPDISYQSWSTCCIPMLAVGGSLLRPKPWNYP